MNKNFLKVWHIVRWPLLVAATAYVALVIYRIPAVGEKQRATEVAAHIHAQKITLADVVGENMPPVPDASQNNATVAGIDANRNGIRDDVEIAIFKKYSNSAKIRAAELQYALALQVEMLEVFNTSTWIAAAEEDDRGYQCIGETYPRTNLKQFLVVTDTRSDEVKALVLNTQMRKDAYDKSSQFTTSYGLNDNKYCTIDLASLPN